MPQRDRVAYDKQDIFRTNRLDTNISDTSSYLDLAPLYGSSLEDQLKIRTMKGGMLKPDTFHEKRLLGQPPRRERHARHVQPIPQLGCRHSAKDQREWPLHPTSNSRRQGNTEAR